MTGLCKDCKHWQSFELYWQEDGQFYYEELADVDDYGREWMKRRYGTCRLAESNGEKPERADAKAFATDGEHYEAALRTAPDFGCNQFEGRDD